MAVPRLGFLKKTNPKFFVYLVDSAIYPAGQFIQVHRSLLSATDANHRPAPVRVRPCGSVAEIHFPATDAHRLTPTRMPGRAPGQKSIFHHRPADFFLLH